MAGEYTYPCLPCCDLDQSISFYEAMGFQRTYRQLRPNPYAVVVRDDLNIHLFGMPNFDPANSYGSVIVQVPDADALYAAITHGLKAVYGKVPSAGIPRVLRPRKKYGTISGFSVIDPGGNWLRVYQAGAAEESATPAVTPDLAQIIDVAARLGDARGDDALALKTVEQGLARYNDAPAVDRVRALLYRAELLWRLGKPDDAQQALQEAKAIPLDQAEQAHVQHDIDYADDLVRP